MSKHSLKPSSVQVIAQHIRNTIEEFQANIAETGSQNALTEETVQAIGDQVQALAQVQSSSAQPLPSAAEPSPAPSLAKHSPHPHVPAAHESSKSQQQREAQAPSSSYQAFTPERYDTIDAFNTVSSRQRTPVHYEDKDDASSTTTIPSNALHVNTSHKVLSAARTSREESEDEDPLRASTSSARMRSGSFAMSASKNAVEYEITRYRSDSMNYLQPHSSSHHKGGASDGEYDAHHSEDDDLFDHRYEMMSDRKASRRDSYMPGSEMDDGRQPAEEEDEEEQDQYRDHYDGYEEPRVETEEELYNKLKSGQGRLPAKLQPASKVMVMGKHKFGNQTPPPAATTSAANASPSVKGKTACERLYINAEIMKKKKEHQSRIKAMRAEAELVGRQYKVNANSKRLLQNIHQYGHEDQDVGTRLYEGGLKDRRKKLEDNAAHLQLRERFIYDWSCAQCGQYESISYNVLNGNTNDYILEKLYICKSCNYNNHDNVYGAHHPTNIGLLYNKDIQPTRQADLSEDIYEYLYKEGRVQDKILKLNKVLYEEMQTNLTFCPQIPLSSKRIIDRNVLKDEEVHPYEENSVATSSTAGTKKVGAQMRNYLSKSATARLSTTHTKAQNIGIAQSKEKRPAPKECDAFVDRLVYEYRDKHIKQALVEKEHFSRDQRTQQPLFAPRVEPPPAELYGSSVQTNAAVPIWDKLMAKNAKLQERKQKAEQEAVNKLLSNLSNHPIKALESSNAILESSFKKNISELYKLLLVSNMLYNHSNIMVNDKALFDEDATVPALPDVESLYTYAQSIDNYENMQVDLLAIDTDILINEVSTLLLDMQNVCLRRKKKGGAEDMSMSNASANHGVSATSNGSLHVLDLTDGDQETLRINYDSFVKLATYCIKRRCGPGTGYLYAPKKKPLIALQRKEEEDSHITFAPSIDKTSLEILKNKGDSRSVYLDNDEERPVNFPIEMVLLADGERVQSKIESLRQERIYKAAEELTFRPYLYPPPKHIKAKYKHNDEEDDSSTVNDSVLSNTSKSARSERFDDPSLPDPITCAAKPAAKPNPPKATRPPAKGSKDASKWQTSEEVRRQRFLAQSLQATAAPAPAVTVATSASSITMSHHSDAPVPSPVRTALPDHEEHLYDVYEGTHPDSPTYSANSKSTISTKFTIELPAAVHEQHDHLFTDAVYIAQEHHLQATHSSNKLPTPNSTPHGHSRTDLLKNTKSMANSLSYSSCNSSVNSNGHIHAMTSASVANNSSFISAGNSLSEDSRSAAYSGRSGKGKVMRKAVSTQRPALGSQSSSIKGRGLPLPLLPEELHRLGNRTDSNHSLIRVQGKVTQCSLDVSHSAMPAEDFAHGLGSGLDDSSLFSVSTTSTVVKKR